MPTTVVTSDRLNHTIRQRVVVFGGGGAITTYSYKESCSSQDLFFSLPNVWP